MKSAAGPSQHWFFERAVTAVGHRWMLAAMMATCVGWIAAGALTDFETEWFLVSNIVGTGATFLILLLMQNAKARHILAVQAKVDQLILSGDAANHWIGAERNDVQVIEQMRMRHHASAGDDLRT